MNSLSFLSNYGKDCKVSATVQVNLNLVVNKSKTEEEEGFG